MGDQTKRMNVLYRTEKESGVLKDSEKWGMVFPIRPIFLLGVFEALLGS